MPDRPGITNCFSEASFDLSLVILRSLNTCRDRPLGILSAGIASGKIKDNRDARIS